MEQYNPIKIEEKWRKKWLKENRWQVDIKNAKNPYFNLMMFPYPSGEGLHIGNLYAFTGSDIHGRYMRMRGHDVFEPIGFDAFGIHSENFAIKKGVHPRELIQTSTANFRRQLEQAGHMYSWNNLVDTTDSTYYRWTQWLFLQLYKAGLAYHKEAPVLWCPSCQTVLANEQVLQGRCERCDSVVENKKLRQWFLKITNYADRLLDNLDKIDWSQHTKTTQKNWIGKSIGYRLQFKISNFKFQIETFTTRPDTLFGATYLVLSPEHEAVFELKDKIENWEEVEKYIKESANRPQSEKLKEDREKTGVELKGIRALNPASEEVISVWIADYVLGEYGTGAIMAVPAHDQRDFEFAVKFNLPIRPVVVPNDKQRTTSDKKIEGAFTGEGMVINSGEFSGMDSEDAKEKIGEAVGGEAHTQYHLRDWLISRQRYWGPPIPIIYCSNKCLEELRIENNELREEEEGTKWTIVNGDEVAIHPVPEEELPLELPYLEDFRPKGAGKAPLESAKDFVNVKCPKCGGDAKRETDVSDTFFDSSWYFLRYPSVGHDEAPWDKNITKKWLPVDMYIGGQEHAVLHLMYARFITMFLYDQKLIYFEEPFNKFRAHGLLIKDGAKISKSRGNVISPDKLFEAFGADTVRTYLMFLSPLEQGGDWKDEGIRGVHRFLGRVWGLVQKYEKAKNLAPNTYNLSPNLRHKTIKKVTEDIERLHYNTGIATMMTFVNALYENEHSKEDIKTLLILLAPFAPYVTEELWHRLAEAEGEGGGNWGSVHNQKWPEYDKKQIKEQAVSIPVQINGKVKSEVSVVRDMSEKDLEKRALRDEKVQKILGDKEPKKVIVVKNKIVNIVL